MPKFKTKQSIAKRVRMSGRGKLQKRTAGQDHFNTRESGKITKNKRRDTQFDKTVVKNIKRLI